MPKKIWVIPIIFIFFCLSTVNIYSKYFGSNNVPSNSVSNEDFDISLIKLNSLDKLIQYADSIYGSSTIQPNDSLKYASIISSTVRNKFYHGEAKYSWKDNWVLYLIHWIHPHSLTIVEPNNMLRHSESLCSQQSIVCMEALKAKGYKYQKVGFYNEKKKTGHFTYEILLDDGNHYYDVNLEPNKLFLDKLNRPSIDSLVKNKKLLNKAYDSQPKSIREDILPYYFKSGKVNEFPAKKMRLFHQITLYLSLYLWLVILLGYLALSARKKRCVV